MQTEKRKLFNVQSGVSRRDFDLPWHPGKQFGSDADRRLVEQFLPDVRGYHYAHQVHGARIVEAVQTPDRWMNYGEADGFWTRQSGQALLVRVADCLPVFFRVSRPLTVGLVHAGWRGSRENIACRMLETLCQTLSIKPSDIRVTFGPCLRACCYEVGSEFKDFFPDHIRESSGRFYFDLADANRDQLLRAGLPTGQLDDAGVCTSCQPDCHSYRRDGQQAGRMLAWIYG